MITHAPAYQKNVSEGLRVSSAEEVRVDLLCRRVRWPGKVINGYQYSFRVVASLDMSLETYKVERLPNVTVS